ncbi:MAG: hypothetical protein ACLGG4_01925, partial [Gammaproteobacteria bacterium]
MLFINQDSHVPFLTRELKRLLPDGSFASRLWRAIGNELHYRLVDWPDESETEYSSLFPVDALFVWAIKDGGLDPEWLASEDGTYLDDDGEAIQPTVRPIYSAIEQLAAYGLWLLEEMMGSLGPIPEEGVGENGWTRDEVIEHRAACMLLAYQALSYSQRILSGTQLTAEEATRAAQLNFSAMGRAGAQKRHAPMAELRSWAIEKYKAGEWQSANQAAHALVDSVIKHGRSINAHLTAQNA